MKLKDSSKEVQAAKCKGTWEAQEEEGASKASCERNRLCWAQALYKWV